MMKVSTDDIRQIESILDSIVGMKPWSVRLGWGSFLTFEFGKELKDQGYSQPAGEWHLWVYMAAWRLETSHDIVTVCEDSRDFIRLQIKRLQGKTLQKAHVYAPA